VTGLDKTFDYIVPDDLVDVVTIGSRVRVPLHGRRVGAWVIADVSGSPAVGELKSILKSSGLGPDAEVLALCEWAAWRWGAKRVRPLLVTSSPNVVVNRPATPRRTKVVAEPSSPATTTLIADGGGVLRLPPSADQLPSVLAAAKHGPTLVVCPSVDGARVMAHRLDRAGVTTALMPDDWAKARGGVDVVIGGRAAAFAPCPDLAVAMVLDEHDEALQEERVPIWHARDVLIERARRCGAVFVAVSPTPTVAVMESRKVVAPDRERETAAWPHVVIVDRHEVEPWKRSLVSSELIAELHDHSRRVVCVVNTKGQARLLACRNCRALARCEDCGGPMAEEKEGVLDCQTCRRTRPKVCASCSSSALTRVRPGTSRLRFEIEQAAHRAVMEVTGATPDGFDDRIADVFVGTEAALHRVRRVDTVAFLDFDAELLAPRYRANEQAVALLVRAARLVGPRASGGKLIVQTALPDHPVVRSVGEVDLTRLAFEERNRRLEMAFPPFAAFASAEGPGADEFVERVAEYPGVVAVASGDGFLLRAPSPDALADACARTPWPANAKIRLAVDPPRI
jgi:primosomal protein N' (replication factor Y)